jgi:hypothetical protein
MTDRMIVTIPASPDGPAMRRRRGELPPPRRPRLDAHRLEKFAGRLFNERSEPEWRQLAAEDWRAFLERRFVLTDAERDALAAIDDGTVAQIAETVRELVKAGGELAAALPEGRGERGEIVFSRADGRGRSGRSKPATRRPSGRSISIPILKCSFDANCRNWKCRPG